MPTPVIYSPDTAAHTLASASKEMPLSAQTIDTEEETALDAAVDTAGALDAQQLMLQRRSTRAYLPRPVPDALLKQLLVTARQAPSGGNLQPGSFLAVRGTLREQLTTALLGDFESQAPEREDYAYFPRPMPMALRKRQVASAQALYGALEVARDDRAGRDAQFARNYHFFDAPVALIVSIDSSFGPGGYMDLGMALYGLQLAAAAAGLGSCALGAFASYPDTVRRVLGLQAQQHIVCGMALGWADEAAPVNATRTTRAPLHEYFQVLG